MNIVVQKYGGTSVANKEKLETVCHKIKEYIDKNISLVVVVSAQGKTTDELIEKAYSYSKKPDKRALDMLISTGETRKCSHTYYDVKRHRY